MNDSDLRPALTTTMLKSTRTTSAVMSSPWRISWRDERFLEQRGEIFIGGLAEAAVVRHGSCSSHAGWFLHVSEPPCARTLFLAPAGWWVESARRAPAKARVARPFCVNASAPLHLRRAVQLHARLAATSASTRRDRRVDRQVGRIQDHGVGGGSQRCYRPFPRRARRARGYRAKDFQCVTRDSFFDQLLMAPPRPLLRRSRSRTP